jgi:hypothetical protein
MSHDRSFVSWIRNNKEIFTILVTVVVATLWMNNSIRSTEKELGDKISSVKDELIKIETVLIMRGIAPSEMFASNEGIKK